MKVKTMLTEMMVRGEKSGFQLFATMYTLQKLDVYCSYVLTRLQHI